MKPVAYCIILFFFALTSGCVSRTTIHSKGASMEDGSNPTSKVVEKKIIWFWQDEFRKP